jgi:hypothetical protein
MEAFVIYNTGGTLLKWDYGPEIMTKALMNSILCLKRLYHQYRPGSVRALMMGDDMEMMYRLLTSTGGKRKRRYR